MTLNLPDRPSFEHLKYQARDLLSALRRGDVTAARRVKQHLPKAANLTDADMLAATFRLSDAQLVIAREYGFKSWAKLKAHVLSGQDGAASDETASVRRIIAEEVPEVRSGAIEIKAIAREPGKRTKIAVDCADPQIDAVETCMGKDNERAQRIGEKLGGEKLDVVRWRRSTLRFIENAIRPAAVRLVFFDEQARRAVVVMDRDQVPIARREDGLRLRLASELVGWKLDPMPYVSEVDG